MDNTQPTNSTPEEKNSTANAAQAATEPANEEAIQDMASAMADYDNSFPTLHSGDFLKGRVVRVDNEGIYVDVGYKTEGWVPTNQVSHLRDVSPADVVKVGDEISVVVQRVDESEGKLTLSKKRADSEAAWRRILDAQQSGEIFSATCIDQVKGGLIVDVGLRGFVPASHVDVRPVSDLADYVGEVLNLKVLEVDRNRRKVVLSRKNAEIELRKSVKEEAMKSLVEGQIVTGRVARLTNFGAFVDLGGVDGLVHISEISWKRIKHPGDVVKINQQVDVLILKVDPEKERISLSLRQARPDPWLTVADTYKIGDIVKGRVIRFAKNFAFVGVQEGVDAVLPINEIANRHIASPSEVLSVDQEIQAKIIELRPEARRMALSLKQANPEQEHSSNSGRGRGHSEGGHNSLGDLLKAKMGEDGFNKLVSGGSVEAAEETK